MNPAIFLILQATTSLLKVKNQGQFSALKEDIDALIAKLTLELPKKADGSGWTDADLIEAAGEARVGWDNVISRAGGTAG